MKQFFGLATLDRVKLIADEDKSVLEITAKSNEALFGDEPEILKLKEGFPEHKTDGNLWDFAKRYDGTVNESVTIKEYSDSLSDDIAGHDDKQEGDKHVEEEVSQPQKLEQKKEKPKKETRKKEDPVELEDPPPVPQSEEEDDVVQKPSGLTPVSKRKAKRSIKTVMFDQGGNVILAVDSNGNAMDSSVSLFNPVLKQLLTQHSNVILKTDRGDIDINVDRLLR